MNSTKAGIFLSTQFLSSCMLAKQDIYHWPRSLSRTWQIRQADSSALLSKQVLVRTAGSKVLDGARSQQSTPIQWIQWIQREFPGNYRNMPKKPVFTLYVYRGLLDAGKKVTRSVAWDRPSPFHFPGESWKSQKIDRKTAKRSLECSLTIYFSI